MFSQSKVAMPTIAASTQAAHSCPHCRSCLRAARLLSPPDLAKLLAARAGSSSSSSKHALHSAGIKSHVKVPRLNGGKMGVLATRTPHRPVPIGLSTAQVSVPPEQTRHSTVDCANATAFEALRSTVWEQCGAMLHLSH